MITNADGLAYRFANASDGCLIAISPGTYFISAPLKLKSNMTIIGNNAMISPAANFSGDSIIDASGSRECAIRDLRVQSTKAGIGAALKLGRTEEGDGSGHIFDNLVLQGSYDVAVVYSVAAEGCTYTSCNLVTQNDRPCYLNTNTDIADMGLLTNSNTLHWFRSSTFRNYSGAAHTGLIRFNGISSGASIRDGYVYLGTDSTFITFSGDVQAAVFEDIRVEGDGASSLFLKVGAENYAIQWRIARINWTIFSDYVIEANNHLLECDFDFMHVCAATKYIHLIVGKLWRSFLRGNKQNWVTQDSGAEIRSCHLYFVNGEPQEITGTDDNITVWTP